MRPTLLQTTALIAAMAAGGGAAYAVIGAVTADGPVMTVSPSKTPAESPAPAAAAPEPVKTPEDLIAARLDSYFRSPMGPTTFRALSGLGDPGVEPWSSQYPTGNLRGEDQALLLSLTPPGMKPETYAWSSYDVTCRPLYAVSVLKRRIVQFGPDHPYVRRWREAQRAVFAACARRREPGDRTWFELPPELETKDVNLSLLQGQDRTYQAASLRFYSGDIQGALRDFTAIAGSASPHRGAAIYMDLSHRAGEDVYSPEAVPVPAELIAEIKARLADPALADAHPLYQSLLGRIGYYNPDPGVRHEQVAATLAALELSPDALKTLGGAERYARALEDIDHLHGDFENRDWWLTGKVDEEMTASRAMAEAAKSDPMAAWLLFPAPDRRFSPWTRPAPETADWQALSRYAHQAAGDRGGPWQVLDRAISPTRAPDWAFLEAEVAKAQTGDDAALAAVAFDLPTMVRQGLTGHGKAPTAADYDGALGALTAFPWKDSQTFVVTARESLRLLIVQGRIAEARRLRDQLAYKPTAEAGDHETTQLLALLAEDAEHLAPLFNPYVMLTPELFDGLSIVELTRLAQNNDVPAKDRALFARAAWARTYALHRPVPAALDRTMRTLNPEITTGWASTPGAPLAADDPEVLLDVLRTPALATVIHAESRGYGNSNDPAAFNRIDPYNRGDNNWWCPRNTAQAAGDERDILAQVLFAAWRWDGEAKVSDKAIAAVTSGPLRRQSYLLRNRNPAELAALAKLEPGPQRLTNQAIAWVRSGARAGDLDRQAEALALAVRTTRYACRVDHSAYSRAAYTLLHQRFPGSQAANSTPYWFK